MCVLFQQSAKEANLTVQSRLKCAAGLADLATRKYKSAAKHFLLANFDHCDFPEVSVVLFDLRAVFFIVVIPLPDIPASLSFHPRISLLYGNTCDAALWQLNRCPLLDFKI